MKVVAFSFSLATTFWFFRAMGNNYSTDVDFPLYIEYNEDKYVQLPNNTEEVTANISGSGWSLFWAALGFGKYNVNLEFHQIPSLDFILGSQVMPIVSKQIKNVKLNYIVTDTVKFNLEPKIKKSIALVLSDYDLSESQKITSVSFEPKSITIEGPASAINEYPDVLKIITDQYQIEGGKTVIKPNEVLPEEILSVQTKVILETTVKTYFFKEVILTLQLQHPEDSLKTIKQQVSFDCEVNEEFDDDEMKLFLKKALRLDSLSADKKSVVPYLAEQIEGIEKVTIRPSRVLLSR